MFRADKNGRDKERKGLEEEVKEPTKVGKRNKKY